MNISRPILLLFLFIGMHTSIINEVLLIKLEARTINSCQAGNQTTVWKTVSAFVEEVSDTQKMIYITEPTRVAMHSPLSLERLQKIEGKWIKIHLYTDQSFCFRLDHSKTEEMKAENEDLLKRLQKKSDSQDKNEL